MEKLCEIIMSKRKEFKVITYIYTIFLGCFLFPILPINNSSYHDISFWIIRLEMLIICFFISLIFYGLHNKRPVYVFCLTLVLNSIGLIFRILIEWGKFCIKRDLTPVNLGIRIILIPIFITIVNVLLPILNQK